MSQGLVAGIFSQPETSAHTAETAQPLDQGSMAHLSGPHPLHPSMWGSRFQWEPGLALNTGSAHSLAKDFCLSIRVLSPNVGAMTHAWACGEDQVRQRPWQRVGLWQ